MATYFFQLSPPSCAASSTYSRHLRLWIYQQSCSFRKWECFPNPPLETCFSNVLPFLKPLKLSVTAHHLTISPSHRLCPLLCKLWVVALPIPPSTVSQLRSHWASHSLETCLLSGNWGDQCNHPFFSGPSWIPPCLTRALLTEEHYMHPSL